MESPGHCVASTTYDEAPDQAIHAPLVQENQSSGFEFKDFVLDVGAELSRGGEAPKACRVCQRQHLGGLVHQDCDRSSQSGLDAILPYQVEYGPLHAGLGVRIVKGHLPGQQAARGHPIVQALQLKLFCFASNTSHGALCESGRCGRCHRQPLRVAVQELLEAPVGLGCQQYPPGVKEFRVSLDLPQCGVHRYPL